MKNPHRAKSAIAGLCLAVAAMAGWVLPAAAQQQEVALVKVVDGEAFAQRAEQRDQLDVGEAIYAMDVIETAQGSVGLTFKDGTRISIGPNSRVQFTEFVFVPAEGRLSFIVELFRGTMQYISGVIAKLSPDAVKVKTPVATVAVRGTRFLAEVAGD